MPQNDPWISFFEYVVQQLTYRMESLDISQCLIHRTRRKKSDIWRCINHNKYSNDNFNGVDHDKNDGNNGSNEEDIYYDCDEESQS